MPVNQTDLDALTADLAALNSAIASGEKQVALGAQQVTYRSIAELITARNDAQARLNAATAEFGGVQTKSRQTRLYQSGRGY